MNSVQAMGSKERKAREKENLRQEILDAAREMFVRDGYEAVSMRKIAEKVEYSPGTLYLYFRDKAEILDSLCEETFAKLNKRMEAIQRDATDPVDGLRRALLAYIRFGLENPSHYAVTFIYKRPKEHKGPDVNDTGYQCFRKLHGVVQSCIDAGAFASNDAEETAQVLWAGIHGVTSLLVTHCGFPFIEETRLVERVVTSLLDGVRKR